MKDQGANAKILTIKDLAAANAEKAAREARAKISKAMTAIERDIANNDGIYPENKGRVTASEVLRRAGLSAAALQGPAHKNSTRLEVKSFIERAARRIKVGHKSIRKAVTERVEEAKDHLDALQNAWLIARLEYGNQKAVEADLIEKNDALENRVAVLERENKKLRSQLMNLRVSLGSNVIQLRENPEPSDA